jgi:hypothetical protein
VVSESLPELELLELVSEEDAELESELLAD